jgi:hypothetical protein
MTFQLTSDTFLPFIISNAIAIVILWASIGNKAIAKRLLAILFVGAGTFNVYTSFTNPAVYRAFAETAAFDWYKSFITGFFADYTTLIVSFVSIAQFYIGITVLMDRSRFVIACLGGALFGLAIAPLGVGSAFPSSLVLSVAFLTLLVAPSNEHSKGGDDTAMLDWKEKI